MANSSYIGRRGGGGFRFGDIPFGGDSRSGYGFGRGGRGFKKIADPTFDPIDTSGISGIARRIKDAEAAASNPLATPGAQTTMLNINQQLARRAASERGQAVGRAAESGSAGFAGALSQTAGDISARQGEAATAAQADLALQIQEAARAEGATLSQALAQAEAESARIMTEREMAKAQIRAQNEELRLRYEEEQRNNALDQARLAEQARQFGEAQSLEQDKFGYSKQQTELDRQRQREQDRIAEEERKRGFRQQEFENVLRVAPLSDEEYLDDTLDEYVPGFRGRTRRRGPVGSGGWLRPGEKSSKAGGGGIRR